MRILCLNIIIVEKTELSNLPNKTVLDVLSSQHWCCESQLVISSIDIHNSDVFVCTKVLFKSTLNVNACSFSLSAFPFDSNWRNCIDKHLAIPQGLIYWKHIQCMHSNVNTHCSCNMRVVLFFLLDYIQNISYDKTKTDWFEISHATNCMQNVIKSEIQCMKSDKLFPRHKVVSCWVIHPVECSEY